MRRGIIILLTLPALLTMQAPAQGSDVRSTQAVRSFALGPARPSAPISAPDGHTAFPVDVLSRLRRALADKTAARINTTNKE